jgi:acetyltransferase-like isoleucine patch superfamily enzyme
MKKTNRPDTIRTRLITARKSPLKTYIELTAGDLSFIKFLYYEIITSLLGPIPGALGFFLRQKFYPILFKKTGKNLIIGRNVVIRHPGKIEIGNHVTIDDSSLIDAKGAGQEGIILEDQVVINRNCMIQAKAGPIKIGERASIGSYTMITSVDGIEIGKEVLMAGRCHLNPGYYNYNDQNLSTFSHAAAARGPIKIGDKAYLRVGAMIVEGVNIGTGAIIGPGAIVEEDIPPGAIAEGQIAKIIETGED